MDYNKLRAKLEDELEKEVAKMSGEMSPSGLCVVKDLVCVIKDTATIVAMDEGEGYEDGSYKKSYPTRNSTNSYTRGTRSRNSMGQYRSYNHDDTKDRAISTLESMMNTASTPQSREAIRRAIETLEME